MENEKIIKLNKILSEDNEKVTIEWIKENCSEAIERYKKGYAIYKGMKKSYPDYFLRTENETLRSAKNAPMNLHNYLINNDPRFEGFPKREHICSSYRGTASGYGTVYVVLPQNGSTIGILPDQDIYESFTKISDYGGSYIVTLYRYMEEFRDIIRTIAKHSKTYSFDTTEELKKSTNELYKLYKGFDEEQLAKYERIIPSYRSSDLVAVVKQAFEQNKPELILELFDPIDWKYVSISEYSEYHNNEVWTDGSVAMIDYDQIGELLGIENLNETATMICEKQLQLPLDDNGHIIVLAGSPGSGKSYSITNFTNVTDKATTLDIDQVKFQVLKSDKLRAKFKEWMQTAAKDDPVYRDLSDLELKDRTIMKDRTFNNYIHDFVTHNKYFYKKLDMLGKSDTVKNVIIDGTLRYIPSTENKIKRLYKKGYTPEKVHLVYVYSSLELALQRNSSRSRSADDGFVKHAFSEVINNILEFIRKKEIIAHGTGSFSIIVNDETTNTSNLTYYRIMKDGVWNDAEIKKFIAVLSTDMAAYKNSM